MFSGGDVLICSPTGRTWKLHSMILSQASPKLRSLLETEQPMHVPNKQRTDGKTVRWRLQMVAFEANPTNLNLRAFQIQACHPMCNPCMPSFFLLCADVSLAFCFYKLISISTPPGTPIICHTMSQPFAIQFASTIFSAAEYHISENLITIEYI